ncbi:MAG: CDP-alcohol phosphatidyltransferase family protein [Candidatus Dormibacteraceae bacterium]
MAFWAGAAASAGISAASVRALARRHPEARLLTAANLLTLSRGIPAAVLAGLAASGRRDPGLSAWLGPIYGCTVSDWLDGPLARRTGKSRLGHRFDAQADAWLTLSAAAAAWRTGALPGCVLAPPLARWLRPDLRGAADHHPLVAWQRTAGVGQMVVLAAALSPSRRLRRRTRSIAAAAAAFQLLALAAPGRSRAHGRARRAPAHS